MAVQHINPDIPPANNEPSNETYPSFLNETIIWSYTPKYIARPRT